MSNYIEDNYRPIFEAMFASRGIKGVEFDSFKWHPDHTGLVVAKTTKGAFGVIKRYDHLDDLEYALGQALLEFYQDELEKVYGNEYSYVLIDAINRVKWAMNVLNVDQHLAWGTLYEGWEILTETDGSPIPLEDGEGQYNVIFMRLED